LSETVDEDLRTDPSTRQSQAYDPFDDGSLETLRLGELERGWNAARLEIRFSSRRLG
jgi:hypothetical protein